MALAPIVAVEIGTTKTVAVVGELRDDEHVAITGMGEAASSGVRKGEIIDFENAIKVVRGVLERAEELSREPIKQVHLALSGGHVQSLVHRGSVPVMDPGHVIRQEDMEQCMEVARAVNLSADREILHTMYGHFRVDDQDEVVQPEGLVGANLSLDLLVLHGMRSRLHTTVRVLRNVPVGVEDVAFSGLCAALGVLTAEQKRSGVVVIDLGGGTTSYLVYAGNVVAAAGAFGVGGDHITNDIMVAFNVPVKVAERLKRTEGSALVQPSGEGARRIDVPDESTFHERSVSVKSLQTVIHARADETLCMVRKRLENTGLLPQIGGGVVLTGGGARLKGLTSLAQRVFEMPCAVGVPRNVNGPKEVSEGPEYATVCGLINYGYRSQRSAMRTGLGLTDWLKGLFGR